MIPNLTNVLANRKKFIDEVSEIGTGTGHGSSSSAGMDSKVNAFSFTPKSDTGLIGLQNQGATCYLNSLIQTLFCCCELRKAVFQFKYDKLLHGAEERCLTRQLQKLFALLQLSDRGAVSTGQLTASFGWSSADSFMQQDVQECMAVIFEHIQGNSDPDLSSFFANMWTGVYFDGLTCRNCNQSRGHSSTFRDLQVPVRGQVTLQNSIASYLEAEELDGVSCDVCDGKFPHFKGFDLKSLPYFLSFQLKRFDIDWNTGQRIKINDPLSFPSVLDMSAFLSAEHRREGEAYTYDLLAVLIHSGGAHAGHYFCFVRDLRNNRWNCCNDSTITSLSNEEIRKFIAVNDESSNARASSEGLDEAPQSAAQSNESKPKYVPSASNAYMLLYRRRSFENINEVPVACIPQDLRDYIIEDNIDYSKKKAQWDYEKAFLRLSVKYEQLLLNVSIHETCSIAQLVEMVHAAIIEQKQKRVNNDEGVVGHASSLQLNAEAVKKVKLPSALQNSQSNPIVVPDKSTIRFRIFDSIRGVLLGHLGQGDHSKVLASLAKADVSRPLQVEICAPFGGQLSMEDECIPISVVRFNINSASSDPMFSPPQSALVPTGSTAALLKDILRARLLLPVEASLVCCTVDESTGVATQLAVDDSETLEAKRIAGETLYVDVVVEGSSLDASCQGVEPRMLKYFNDFRNQVSIQVKYLVVAVDGNYSQDELAPFTELSMLVDQRWTLAYLKTTLSKSLGLEESKFSLHLPGHKLLTLASSGASGELQFTPRAFIGAAGIELKDTSVSIQSATIVDKGLQLLPRCPLLPNQCRVALHLQRPTMATSLREECLNAFLVPSNIETVDSAAAIGQETPQDAPLELQLISDEIIVSKEDTVSDLKSRVYQNFIWKFLSEEFQANYPKELSSSDLPMRLRLGVKSTGISSSSLNATSSAVSKLGPPLRDGCKLVDAVKPSTLADNTPLVIQIGEECIGEITENHILLNVLQWHCVDNSLGNSIELALPKDMTYKQFFELLLAKSIVSDIAVLLAKPFAWQLKDKANIPLLKWSQQPRAEDMLGMAPWRLQNNSIVLFVNTEQYRSMHETETCNTAFNGVTARLPSTPEVGFKIYSAQEQIVRDAEQQREAAERKEAISARMDAMLKLSADKS